ncbi:MAG: antirestriction protein ArdA [bacterium]|nr:antirestriction protein ArdA [bacterium]
MSDYIFKAFIVNCSEYDNGNKETSGAWLYFPTDAEAVKNTLAKIGLSENASPDTYFFDDYIYKSGDNETVFPKKAAIDELNYLSVLLGGMNKTERNTFDAVIETKEHTANIASIINLAHNIDCYNLVYNMYSWENVGSYIAEQQGFDVGVIGDLADYIDYAAYGKDYAERNGGYFLSDVYLERVSTDFKIKYNGVVENIPPEYKIKPSKKQITEKGVNNMSDYIFKAFIVNSFEYDNGNKETSGAWLYFPSDAETVKRTFAEIGLSENASPDTYFFDDYACGNDDLKKCFSQYESVDALNYLAMRISALEDVEMAVFQIALEAGKCKNVIDAINLTYNTEYYDVWHEISDYDDLGRNMLLDKDIILGELCEYFDLEAYAMETERSEGGKLINGVYLKPGCTDFKKVYEGNTIYIPSEYRVTSVEYEQGYSDEKFNQANGIINNTDKKPSIKEQLRAISNERPKSEQQPQKKPREETL